MSRATGRSHEGVIVKVCLIQLAAGTDKGENVKQATRLLESAIVAEAPDLVVLPELFNFIGGYPADARAAAEAFPSGETYRTLQEIAAAHRTYLHAGSMNERAGERVYNTTVVFDRAGREVAKYRKVHLFDVVTPDGARYCESAIYGRGTDIVTYDLDGIRVGCSICYDLRFPELYARLVAAGAEVIAVPSAFTMLTGKDHWEVLCRARAIETQTFLLAPNQCGEHIEEGEQRAKYGNSLVVGPWGTVIARAEDRPGYITARLDFDYLRQVRSQIPVREHHVLEVSV
jgi:predicted amidohydrolase